MAWPIKEVSHPTQGSTQTGGMDLRGCEEIYTPQDRLEAPASTLFGQAPHAPKERHKDGHTLSQLQASRSLRPSLSTRQKKMFPNTCRSLV